MKKIPLSEQFFGLVVAAVLIVSAVVGLRLLNASDSARSTTLETREHRAVVQDSMRRAVAERDSLRAVWAQQKHERDSMRPIWEAQRVEREKKRAVWEAKRAVWAQEKAHRDSIRYAEEHIELILQPFDPNTADSLTLVHLGLRPWMARSVCRYREKGGRYRKKDDFRKAYGMTDSLYQILEPYITINETASATSTHLIKKDTIIELNSADTTLLKYIRGIGSYTAKKIVERRERLGGYVSVAQLSEITPAIRNIDSILPHLTADSALIRPIRINTLSVDAMVKHPYLSFDQAKAIREQRHRKGPIRSEKELLQLKKDRKPVFSEEEMDRLRPYLSYEE